MAGWNLFARCRIVNIFNTIFTEHKSPIGFRFLWELRDNRFINARRLIKFAGKTQPICACKQCQFLLIILFWNYLLRSAVFADCDLAVFFDILIAAAHLALDNCHSLLPLSALFRTSIKMI